MGRYRTSAENAVDTALHEAAHLVAGYDLGGRIEGAYIRPNGRSGWCRIDKDKLKPADMFAVILAPVSSITISRFTPLECQNDLNQAKEYLERWKPGLLKGIELDHDKVLIKCDYGMKYGTDFRYFAIVKRLAEVLAERRWMDGQEIARVIEEAWPPYLKRSEKSLPPEEHMGKDEFEAILEKEVWDGREHKA